MSWSVLLSAIILTAIAFFFLWVTVVRPAFQSFSKSHTNKNDMDAHAESSGHHTR